ncbi:MAG: hypothetical protein IJ888_09840 [Prevotella sp.]|jgi:hypothetical protein|nr:hypothetical protein [Prevotella sp.]
MDRDGKPTFNINFHGPVGSYQYIENFGTLNQFKDGEYVDAEEVKEVEIPELLKTDEAKDVLGNFIYNRLLTEELQPIDLSGTEQALLARVVSEKLEINDVWQVFGRLWNIKPETLRKYYNRAFEQKKSLEFQDYLKKIIG